MLYNDNIVIMVTMVKYLWAYQIVYCVKQFGGQRAILLKKASVWVIVLETKYCLNFKILDRDIF